MKNSGAFRYALTIGAAAALLAGCGGGEPPIGAPDGLVQANRTALWRANSGPGKYAVLFSFDNSDGAQPLAGLVNVNGTLYGTTFTGGAGTHCADSDGCGTVFSVTPSGTETVLYEFRGGRDGDEPNGGLTNVNGTLYGTTRYGGACKIDAGGCGTVFSVTPAGKEHVLYRFPGHPYGESPTGWLTNVNGTLYGTTQAGGERRGGGTLFSITTTGKERLIYVFGNKADDGTQPSSLAYLNGSLYGTMYDGGTKSSGLVFGVTLAGKERVLYDFTGPPDGAFPIGGLRNVNGTLYGTTSAGGNQSCASPSYNCGTVFKITTSGKEQVLYRFTGSPPDGAVPNGDLLNVRGTLYGTTFDGGSLGAGTVFSVTLSGKERVLHSFGVRRGRSGAYPVAGLTELQNVLYGTTYAGGDDNVGTAFALKY